MGPATHYKGLHQNRQRTQPRFALWRLDTQDIADDGLHPDSELSNSETTGDDPNLKIKINWFLQLLVI